MARTPKYDPEPLNRFRYNSEAVEASMNRVVEDGLNPLVEVLNDEAQRIEDEHGVPYEIAALWVYAQVQKAWEDQLYYRAALTRRAGVPKVGIADVMQWRGSSSVLAKRWPELDDLAKQYSRAKDEAERTGEPQKVRLPSSFSITVQPGTD